MLTLEKIRIFKEFRGDIDSFGRSGREVANGDMDDNDFYLIDSLVHDYFLIYSNLASQEYGADFMKKLGELCGQSEISMVLMEFKNIKNGVW
jgi:hypothetical protein